VADETESALAERGDNAVGHVHPQEGSGERGCHQPASDQERSERHQQPWPKSIKGEPNQRRCDRVNEKISRGDGGAVAAGPGEFLQQGEIIHSEGAVDPAHDDHVGETQREDNVAVEEPGRHERNWSVGVLEYWSAEFYCIKPYSITPVLHDGLTCLPGFRCFDVFDLHVKIQSLSG
jgi:hypothetical protein